MVNIKIGIIGGTGLDNPEILKNRKEVKMTTRFGDPSDGVVIEVTPSKVNYRGNIWALKEVGCTHIIASSATGSLKEDIKPGDLVIADDFLDRTYKRQQSFYDGEPDSLKGVFHLPVHPPFSAPLRKVLIDTAKEIGLYCHERGTIVTIEGPRFSSKAESTMYQMLGGDLVNMTTIPEVILAKEAGILYAVVALATDYDCWKEDYGTVSHEKVLEMFKNNVDKVLKLICAAVQKIAEKNWDAEILQSKELVERSLM
ncbi:Phosphorylase superfamily [Popillia japonica]|uniref:Purine nucleoside phosphorylase n=1 Tax=Popillia japonica TaxID=7064 RepID=A0AAW1LV26_POPJA